MTKNYSLAVTGDFTEVVQSGDMSDRFIPGLTKEYPLTVEYDLGGIEEVKALLEAILYSVASIAYIRIADRDYDIDYSSPDSGVVVSPLGHEDANEAIQIQLYLQGILDPKLITRDRDEEVIAQLPEAELD